MKQIESAGIVVYFKQDTILYYLLLHYIAGHWDFPKGKIEPGETKQEAAQRELQEETGLNALINPSFEQTFSYLFINYDGKQAQKTAYFFVGQALQDHVVLSHEHQGFAWLPFEQALEQLTYDNAKELLRKAHAFITLKSTARP